MSDSDVSSGSDSEQLPEVVDVIPIEMLDRRVAKINRMITSDSRFCPKTIDASMVESDEFLGQLNKFMEQKLLLAKKCVKISNFVEDLHGLIALALTPALVLIISMVLVFYSEENFPTVPFFNISDELKPFVYFCWIPSPLYLYFLYITVINGRLQNMEKDPNAAPYIHNMATLVAVIWPKVKGWIGSFDKMVIGSYPTLKEWSETFRNDKQREAVVLRVWGLTGYCVVLFLALKPRVFLARIAGLLIVAGVNLIVGCVLVSLLDFSSSLHDFYSPVETMIRIMSFSPLFYTILGTFAGLCIPILTEQVDYKTGREMSIVAIQIAEEKLQGLMAVQGVMRNVRELIKVTSHVQTLAEGLSMRKIDRAAGFAIASEGTKVAGKIIRWTGSKIMERLSSPEVCDNNLEIKSPLYDNVAD